MYSNLGTLFSLQNHIAENCKGHLKGDEWKGIGWCSMYSWPFSNEEASTENCCHGKVKHSVLQLGC